MLRRVATIAATIALALLSAAPAVGWGNGPNDGNGYGTHDWALEHAITLAGGSASWIDVRTALLATDDPDYGATAMPGEMHAYKNTTGASQGGPQAVSDEYYKLMRAYDAGNYKEASRLLGTMSHYYLDICQPYHDDTRGSISVNSRHLPYELDVSDMTSSYSHQSSWVRSLGRTDVTDIRQRAVTAALYARSKYSGIDASYKSYGVASGRYANYSTGYVLNRGINDLADIIQAVPKGEGLAKAPTTMKHGMQKMTYHFPRKGTRTNDTIRTQVYCYDAAGKPIQGLAVTFTWPLSTGLKSALAYTDANGLAYSWQAPGYGVPLMQKRTVTATTVQSGQEATSSTWYTPTPVLAYSTLGMKSGVSNTSPKRYATVKSWTRVRDTAGNPVVGLPVTFSWHFKSTTYRVTSLTNASGYAYASKYIGNSATGYRVYVRTRAYSGRQTRNSSTSFAPR
jgi:hypothetical protein